MAMLKTKYAFTLLVKAAYDDELKRVLEAIRLAQEAIALKPNAPDIKILLAMILIWFVSVFNGSNDPLGDLAIATDYIEESLVTSTVDLSYTYRARIFYHRAHETRYILRGNEEDLREILSMFSMRKRMGSYNQHSSVDSYALRISDARQNFTKDRLPLAEAMYGAQEQNTDNETEEADDSGVLPGFHHPRGPCLVKEAMEAVLLANESHVKKEANRKEALCDYVMGKNYLATQKTGRECHSDLEKAILHLELAQVEPRVDASIRQLSSMHLAEARWKLGKETKDLTQYLKGIESMAMLLDDFTADVSPETSVLIDIMEESYHFWTMSEREEWLVHAASFVRYFLRDDVVVDPSTQHLFAHSQKQALLQEPLVYWRRCWQDGRATLHVRLHAMHLASKHLFGQGRFEDAFQYAKTAVDLVRFACPAHLDISEREQLIPLLNGISVDACALGIKLGRNEEALELLEQGRGILNFLPEAFADSLNELRRDHPQLYARFDQCRESILASISFQQPSELKESGPESPDDAIGGSDVAQMASVLTEIRQEAHYQDFYRPVTAAEMQSLATMSPIVVLVGSSLHPYAAVVRQESIQIVDLSPEAVNSSPTGTVHFFSECCRRLNHIYGCEFMSLDFSTEDQARTHFKKLNPLERAANLDEILASLWIAVVEPINRNLDFGAPADRTFHEAVMNARKSLVTWIRTGFFSRMPVPVAGTMGSTGTSFISRAISSFAASFQSLSLTVSRNSITTRGLEKGLIITMPSKGSKSYRSAPFLRGESVKAEVSAVKQAATSIEWSVLERPSAQDVKERLPDARFVQFICHGVEDQQEPRKSHLKLWKDTGPGKGRMDPFCRCAKRKLLDENLDIANSFAVAGVQHVVGSMWEVQSSVAAKIASTFWRFLSTFFPNGQVLTGELVAQALNIATIAAVMDNPGDPMMWAGFIHIGGMASHSLAKMRGNEDEDEESASTTDGEEDAMTHNEIYGSEDEELWEEGGKSDPAGTPSKVE